MRIAEVMKKSTFGTIAGAGIILMLMCCSTGGRKVSTWKPYKKNVITWQKLDTFVFENPTFKVEYPDFFVPDSSVFLIRMMPKWMIVQQWSFLWALES